MKRTQIYIDDQLNEALKRQSKIQKKNVSQIIRDILREKLLHHKNKASVISDFAGMWADRDFDTEKYIRELRSTNRLKRIYE